jgi:hypothetical protein
MKNWERWFRPKAKFEQEMGDELRFHIDQQTTANIAAGMRPQEARRQARLQLGAVEGVKEGCREEPRGFWLETVWSNIRYGLRMMRRGPGVRDRPQSAPPGSSLCTSCAMSSLGPRDERLAEIVKSGRAGVARFLGPMLCIGKPPRSEPLSRRV